MNVTVLHILTLNEDFFGPLTTAAANQVKLKAVRGLLRDSSQFPVWYYLPMGFTKAVLSIAFCHTDFRIQLPPEMRLVIHELWYRPQCCKNKSQKR